MEVQERDLEAMIERAITRGVMIAMIRIGKVSDRIRLSEANRIYTAKNIALWIKAGVIKRDKQGENNSKVTVSRTECDKAAAGLLSVRAKLYIHKYGK